MFHQKNGAVTAVTAVHLQRAQWPTSIESEGCLIHAAKLHGQALLQRCSVVTLAGHGMSWHPDLFFEQHLSPNNESDPSVFQNNSFFG